MRVEKSGPATQSFVELPINTVIESSKYFPEKDETLGMLFSNSKTE